MSTEELLALARFQRLDSRNATEAAMTNLLREMADEIERLSRELNRMRSYLAAGEKWQSIATKPPGERVLLWFPELGYPVTGDDEAYSYKSGGWKASHWMPAPLAPALDVPADRRVSCSVCIRAGGCPEGACEYELQQGTRG